jgi:hypothetical protein
MEVTPKSIYWKHRGHFQGFASGGGYLRGMGISLVVTDRIIGAAGTVVARLPPFLAGVVGVGGDPRSALGFLVPPCQVKRLWLIRIWPVWVVKTGIVLLGFIAWPFRHLTFHGISFGGPKPP